MVWQQSVRQLHQGAAKALYGAARSAARQTEAGLAASGKLTSAISSASASRASMAASNSSKALQMWRQETSKSVFGARSGPTFASSAPGISQVPPMVPSGSSTMQVRSASTSDVAEGGEEDSSTSNSRGGSGTGIVEEGEGEDDDEPLRGPGPGLARRLFPGTAAAAAAAAAAPVAPSGPRPVFEDRTDPLELLVFTKERFLQQPHGLPDHVREALYAHRWDKLLIDVRRTVSLHPKDGKVESYTAMVAVGNMRGLFGLGLGEQPTAQEAVAQAYVDAYSRLQAVPLYRGHTLYHFVEHKYHHMKMRLMPRPSGWGVKASDLLVELCALAGIQNVSIKMFGRSKVKFYVAQCFFEALQKQSTPFDGIEGSGVYVREVWHKHDLPMGLKRGVDVA